MSKPDYTVLGDEPIQTTTIKDEVYRRLKSVIIEGNLRPGQRLIEGKLAVTLNVSRTPLREAIQVLVQERFLERLPQGGVQVASISQRDIRDLNSVRSALEALAAKNAARNVARRTPGPDYEVQLSELDAVIEQLSALTIEDETIEFLQLGRRFHQIIHHLSDNPRCSEILQHVIDSMERYRGLVPKSRNLVAVEEHKAIANAIKRGDPQAAERLMREHIEGAGAIYETTLVKQTVADEAEAASTRP